MYKLFPTEADVKHGNNAMLRAAQPKTPEELYDAVNKLRVEILKERFIADQGIDPMPVLFAQIEEKGEAQTFYPVEIPQNGDSLFQALCTSRKEVGEILNSLRLSSQIRATIAPSILNALVKNRIPCPDSNNNKENIKLYSAALHEVNELYSKIKSDHTGYFFSYELDLPPEDFVLAIDSKMILGEQDPIIEAITRPLKKIVNQCKFLRQELLNECQKIEVYDHYVFQLRNNMSLNLSIPEAKIIASHIKIAVNFWEQSTTETNLLSFQDGCGLQNPLLILNIYHQKSSPHFDLLLDVQLFNGKSFGNDKFIFDTINFYNFSNYDTDNALLRAVRSPAAGELVPFLLNLGFDVNGKHSVKKNQFLNGLNKTPLHRAIRYFSEFRPMLIQQMGEESYRTSMEKCFSALVEAGADFTIQEIDPRTRKPLHTPMDRAEIANQQFGWSDLNFKLSDWLQNLRGQLTQGVINPAVSLPKLNNTMPHKGNYGPVMVRDNISSQSSQVVLPPSLPRINNNVPQDNYSPMMVQANNVRRQAVTLIQQNSNYATPGVNPHSIFGQNIMRTPPSPFTSSSPSSSSSLSPVNVVIPAQPITPAPMKKSAQPSKAAPAKKASQSTTKKRPAPSNNNNNNTNAAPKKKRANATQGSTTPLTSNVSSMNSISNLVPMTSFDTTAPRIPTTATNVFDMRNEDLPQNITPRK